MTLFVNFIGPSRDSDLLIFSATTQEVPTVTIR